MTEEKKKLIPGDPLPMVKMAELLFASLRPEDPQKLELIALDLRGTFRVGSESIDGSVSGTEGTWKLYLSDSWEYRYMIDKEIRSLKIKKCDRIVAVFRSAKTGDLYQGRILASSGDQLEWKFVEMKPQEQ